MKIKIILIVFILIIASSFVFTILSSKTTTNNNKIYFIETFIKSVCNHEVPLAKISKAYFPANQGKDKLAKDQLLLSALDTLRNRIGQAYPKDFKVIQYYDLAEKEQVLTLSADSLDNIFIVKQQGKKILNILMNDTKIVSLHP